MATKKKITAKRKPRVLKVGLLRPIAPGTRQTARGKKQDKVKKALKPGKRVSKNGTIYWESRRNRADL